MNNDSVQFAKMNGIGNQILVVDMRGRKDVITPEAAIALDQHIETKFDQIMAIHDAQNTTTDNYIHILNSDGSNAEACGNGTRCVVTWLNQFAANLTSRDFDTLGGLRKTIAHEDGTVSVDMGTPKFNWQDIPISEPIEDTRKINLQYPLEGDALISAPALASMGNPHVTFFTQKPIAEYPITELGPFFEDHPLFPNRVNVTIAHVFNPKAIEMVTWERGAGLTLACGSGACAAVVNGIRRGFLDHQVDVTMPGGILNIVWQDDDHIIMRGATEFEFSGSLNPHTGEWTKTDRTNEGAA
jgi:diaminopimelate epimerase